MGFAPKGITALSELTIDVEKNWAAKRILNLLDPTGNQDAATKKYHDDNPGGISKLSELEIDTSKDWLTYLIKNIGAAVDDADAVQKIQAILQAVMTTEGDILYRGASEAERIAGAYGVGYNFLHMANTGQLLPEWLDILDIITYMTGAVNKMVAPPTLAIPAPELSLVVAEDHSGGANPAAPDALVVSVPTIAKAAVKSDPAAVGGGVAHDDDGVDTDETTETNNATENDMHLLPDPGAVGDGFYFGLANPFDWLVLNIGTAGVGTWTITWKYWDGDTWEALTLIGAKDETANFRTTGKKWVSFTRPGDWASRTIEALNLYWIKGECTAHTSMTTQPLGTQAWIGRYT